MTTTLADPAAVIALRDSVERLSADLTQTAAEWFLIPSANGMQRSVVSVPARTPLPGCAGQGRRVALKTSSSEGNGRSAMGMRVSGSGAGTGLDCRSRCRTG